jgi:hypothetical protein
MFSFIIPQPEHTDAELELTTHCAPGATSRDPATPPAFNRETRTPAEPICADPPGTQHHTAAAGGPASSAFLPPFRAWLATRTTPFFYADAAAAVHGIPNTYLSRLGKSKEIKARAIKYADRRGIFYQWLPAALAWPPLPPGATETQRYRRGPRPRVTK